jgi:type IV secretory pathway VirJ component
MKNISFVKSTCISLLIYLFQSYAVSGQTVRVDSVLLNRFGKVYIYSPATEAPKNLIILISGGAGWNPDVSFFAKEFALMNSVVIGVDILSYYKYLNQAKTECYLVSSDFVELATSVERKFNFPGYIPPVLMGYSSGATLVYGILAQARAKTFIGGISLGFCPEIDLPNRLCQLNGLEEKELIPGKSYLFAPDASLGNPWIVLQGEKDKICNIKSVTDFVSKTHEARLIILKNTGHDFSYRAALMAIWKDAYNEITNKYLAEQSIDREVPILKNIPFNLTLENIRSDKPFAIMLSGDGGWYGFEQSLADRLANIGISVIGIDSKKYFWKKKTPEQTASDIAALLRYFGTIWGKSEYIIIGYSQGAEIVPYILTRLPEDIRLNVKSGVMLSPETKTDFEIHISNMLGIGNSQNTYDVIAEIMSVNKTKQIIIFGDGEKTSVPDLLKGKGVEIVKIPGDHHYKFNSELIVETMKSKNAF